MRQTRTEYYRHDWGGTVLGRAPGARGRYPSDDAWVRRDGAEVISHSTVDRHFDMPLKIKSAREIRWLTGVGKVTTLRPNASEASRKKANRKP